MDCQKTSLSAPPCSATPTDTRSSKTVDCYKTSTSVKPVTITVEDGHGGAVSGYLHVPAGYEARRGSKKIDAAAILLSGAWGGVVGPSSIYLSMADKLASLRQGIPVLRLDYRFPAHNKHCVEDVYAAMKMLRQDHEVARFILVGWSFGGAPVFTVGGAEQERVLGCATVASQTAEAGGIRHLSPRPVLLLHGTADKTLSAACSEGLYRLYGPGGDRTLHLYQDDDHALTRNAADAAETLCSFIAKCAGVDIEAGENEALTKPSADLDEPEKDSRDGEHAYNNGMTTEYSSGTRDG
jgi:dienelactone hydrolase